MTYSYFLSPSTINQILATRIALAALLLKQSADPYPWVRVLDSDQCHMHTEKDPHSLTNMYFHASQWGIGNILSGNALLELEAPPALAGTNLAVQLRDIAIGFSVRQLSDAVGVSHTRFYEWLSGAAFPPERTADFEQLIGLFRELRLRHDYRALVDRPAIGLLTVRDLIVTKKWSAVSGLLHQLELSSVTCDTKVLRTPGLTRRSEDDLSSAMGESDVNFDQETTYAPFDNADSAIPWTATNIK